MLPFWYCLRWDVPKIEPYGDFKLDPSSTVREYPSLA